jgi:hypothetical protein
MVEHSKPEPADEDRVAIPLDSEEAHEALLKVDPDAPPAKPNAEEPSPEPPLKDQGDPMTE